MDNMESVLDKVHHNDLLTLCGRLPDHSIDMILCDLPYGTTACSWDTVIPFDPMWVQFHRVAKAHAAIVLTAIEPFASHLRMTNIERYKYDWVWVKTSASDFLNAKNKPMRKHEKVLVFSSGTTANKSRGKMVYYPQNLKPSNSVQFRPSGTVNTRGISYRPSHVNLYVQEYSNYPDSVLLFSNGNNHNVHPTQKPVALCEYLIKTYTQPGELVLDPCCGSGTTGIAALNTGRKYILGDIGKEWVDVSRQRINAHDPTQHTVLSNGKKQLSLFANEDKPVGLAKEIGDEG